jgi:hypothetical protein
MLVTNDCGKVKISGDVEETKTFSIAATPHAYSILSSGIYSNKIRAVIRELSTNAYDAHVFSNKLNIPFNVILPGKFNPTFTIRDYGPGMSEEDIMNLYTTYFQSGSYKIKSNDFVGCLGLGSKSPFAYTRSFSVTSYYQGKRTNYALYIGSNGVPNITNMGSEDTLEESGLLVSIPVNNLDFDRFCTEAENVYKYFKIQPNISGNSLYKIEDIKYIHESKSGKWKVRLWNGFDDINIIMGNICYPLNVKSLNSQSDFLETVKGLDIFVDIGSVNITPSREHLQYDKQTINYILDVAEDIANEIKLQVETEISTCKSLWEARKKRHYLCNINKGFNIISTLPLKWNNKLLYNDIIYFDSTDTQDSFVFFEKTRRFKRVALQKPLTNVNCFSNVILVENDIAPKKGAFSRCLKCVRDTHSVVYLFSKISQKLIDKLDCLPEEIIKVSSLPKQERIKNDSSVKYASKSKIFKYRDTHYNSDYAHWVESEIDLNNGGFYVELGRYLPINIRNGLPTRNWFSFNKIINTLTKYNKDFCLYGVRASTVNKINKNKKWINLYEYIQSIVNGKNNDGFLQDFYNADEYYNNCDEIIDNIKMFPVEFIQQNLLFKELCDAIDELNVSTKTIEQQNISLEEWKLLFNSVGVFFTVVEPKHKLQNLWNQIIEKYFMIKYITKSYDGISNKNIKDIMQYVKQVKEN